MHYLDEYNIALFLIQVGLLVAAARSLGEVLRRWNQPSITADILVGVFLGPTVLGRLAPQFQRMLFPPDAVQMKMLETVAWLGLFFFLLETGLELDFSSAWRQRREALVLSLCDLVIPMIVAFIPCVLLLGGFVGEGHGILVFSLFVAAVMTISALPATARVLQDLRIYKTDIGFLIMCALAVNDILGWIVFTLILGFSTTTAPGAWRMAGLVGAVVGFTAVCLTFGRAAADAAINRIQRMKLPEPGSSLTFIVVLGMTCGAVTALLGIHALFGFFVAGIMAGEARRLSERTRQVISQMVHAIFIPLFFASLGLKVDVAASFNLKLIVFMLSVGIAGRYLGAWTGVTFAGSQRVSRNLISIAHVPGGEMQIVVSLLALENGLIREDVFVAVVFGAVVTSAIVGPWMALALRRRPEVPVLEYCDRALAFDLSARERDAALREMCSRISMTGAAPLSAEELYEGVRAREEAMGTGLENGVAVPHARPDGVERPVVAVGRSREGIEWNAPDGKPARIIFLLLTPPADAAVQLQILRTVAEVYGRADERERLLRCVDAHEMWQVLKEALRQSSVHAPGA